MLVCGVSCSSTYWRADREAEGARLLSEYRMQILSGVRIPSSPPDRSGSLRVAERAFFMLPGPSETPSNTTPTFFSFVLDEPMAAWQYIQLHAALPQLDRGPDYESGRHRFESYTPHHARTRGSPGSPSFLSMNHAASERRPKLNSALVAKPHKGVGDARGVAQVHQVDESKLLVAQILFEARATNLLEKGG